jgi:hypothetical protein
MQRLSSTPPQFFSSGSVVEFKKDNGKMLESNDAY